MTKTFSAIDFPNDGPTMIHTYLWDDRWLTVVASAATGEVVKVTPSSDAAKAAGYHAADVAEVAAERLGAFDTMRTE